MSATTTTIVTTAAQRAHEHRNPFDGKLARGPAALLVLCSVSTGCATLDPQPSYSNKILLGMGDEIVVPRFFGRIDDYTCAAAAALVCEEYGSKLRCRCSDGEVIDFRR